VEKISPEEKRRKKVRRRVDPGKKRIRRTALKGGGEKNQRHWRKGLSQASQERLTERRSLRHSSAKGTFLFGEPNEQYREGGEKSDH